MRKFILAQSLLILATALSAQQAWYDIQVSNRDHERFEQTASCKLPKDALKGKQFAIVESNATSKPLPAALDTTEKNADILTWIVPGITAPGATRSFKIIPCEQTQPQKTDLTCVEDEDKITIETTYFRLNHPKSGNGGFPKDITYRFSGVTDSQLHFLDRLFMRGVGQYCAKDDPQSTARVVFNSPVRVVIEATTGYGNRQSSGNLMATYHYVYTANSPVIQVSAEVVRFSGDTQPWSELHFLHLSRKDLYYTSYLMGNPFKEHIMQTPGTKSRGLSAPDWLVMSTGSEAAGIGGKNISAWDASNEFVYYILKQRPDLPSEVNQRSFEGLLYFGPSVNTEAWFDRWLGKNRDLIVTLTPSKTTEMQMSKQEAKRTLPDTPHVIESNDLKIAFSGPDMGFSILGLQHKLSNEIFCENNERAPGHWSLVFTSPNSEEKIVINNKSAFNGTAEKIQNGIRFTWSNLDLSGEKKVLDIISEIVQNQESNQFEWKLTVINRSKTWGLWTAEYPYLPTILANQDGEMLLPGGNWGGRIVKNPNLDFSPRYPSTTAPMQFMAFNIKNAGLYFAAHDPDATPKHPTLKRPQDTTIRLIPENAGQPGTSLKQEFPIVLKAYNGNWWNAAKIYRNWVLKQIWTAKGPIVNRKDYPKQFIDNGFWLCLSGTPQQIKGIMEETAKIVNDRVPFGVHWYCWHQIPFDHTYPEYFPAKEGFSEITRELTAKNMLIMPYINGRLWDMDIDSFKNKGINSAAKDQKGNPYIEIYGSKRRLVPNCPYTKQWQDTVNDICRQLIDNGVNGIYLDQIGAAAPALCFDKSHGHPLGGGKHWCIGYRQMLNQTKKMAMEKGVTLTTENTAEPYMDNIDGFLTWIQQNENDVPALPAVYSGYTIYFSSPQSATDTFDAFRACQGRNFLWGCQLGWVHWFYQNEHRDKFEYLIKLAILQKKAKNFFVLGELLGELENQETPMPMTMVWNRTKPHDVTIPPVESTVWKDPAGNLLVAVVNYSNEPQSFVAASSQLQIPDKSWKCSRINEFGHVTVGLTTQPLDIKLTLKPQEIAILIFEETNLGNRHIVSEMRHQFKAIQDAELKDALAEALLKAENIQKPELTSPCFDLVQGEYINFVFKPFKTQKSYPFQVSLPDGTDLQINTDDIDGKTISWTPKSILDTAKPQDITFTVPRRHGYFKIPIAITYVPRLSIILGNPQDSFAGESFLLPAEVKNNSRYPQKARINLNAPSDWTIEPARSWDTGTLAPNETSASLLKIDLPEGANAGYAPISASIVQDTTATRIAIKPSRPRMIATYKGKPGATIVTLGPAQPNSVKIDTDYNGADDCSAKLSLNWDEDCLYVNAEITDDVHSQDSRDASVWKGDCIQFALREGLPNKNQNYDGSEVEFALAFTGDNEAFVYRWGQPGQGDIIKSATASVTKNNNVFVYKASIPWSELNLSKPSPNKRLTGSFTVNDNDGKGFKGWLEWTPGICGNKDSSAFGWIILK